MTASGIMAPEQQALKQATRALVRAFGGQEAAAVHVSRAQSRISDWCSVNRPDFMGVDAVLALEGATQGLPGAPHVTRALAQASGYALVRLPDAGAGVGVGQTADVFGWLANLAKEAGEVQAALGTALANDRAVTPSEAPDIRQQIHELQTLLAGMDAGLAEIERAG